ncbi:myotubularin-related protein 9 [Cimex lectularius]|uniref:Myotubularin phosphatase domain-containing protein n=1 Tax=Cimex lectularius TaxID=79782 RepID=A0A8I6RI31_CIMLE|nr:myotubularin-related protein 9 [Cimex lectularius]
MEFADMIRIPKLDGVVMVAPCLKPIEGTLCITGHHMIFSARTEGVDELWLLHENVDALESRPAGQQKERKIPGGTIVIKCKDLRIIYLNISSSDQHYYDVLSSLEILSGLENPTLKYPFFFRPMYKILEDGWTAFIPEVEFTKILKHDEWRITTVNSDYSVCPSYPKTVAVPKCIDDETILAAARFREGGRFPVLSYRHEGGGVLIRSSQPLLGPTNKRSREDEKLINSVIPSGKRGFIVDTRTLTRAQTAKSRGGGFEMEMHYLQWKRIHTPIDKYQNVLEKLTKLVEACNDVSISSDKWLSKLDSSGWLTHVRDTLNCACQVAQILDQEGASVLVHGAEGMDATLIVTSLTQVILNPDCRTVRGFEAVIEREWLQGGYPFAKRHAHSCYSPMAIRTKQEAPTFLLFLDCVYQIHHQFPCSFEFSTEFLVLLFEHSYASQFGTFLGNNELEREQLKVSQTTTSLWSHINQLDILPSVLNPLYEPNNTVIWPSVAPMSLELWAGVFLRWVMDRSAEKEFWTAISALKEKEKDLRHQAVKLRRKLADLERELLNKDDLLEQGNTLDIKH